MGVIAFVIECYRVAIGTRVGSYQHPCKSILLTVYIVHCYRIAIEFLFISLSVENIASVQSNYKLLLQF